MRPTASVAVCRSRVSVLLLVPLLLHAMPGPSPQAVLAPITAFDVQIH